MRFSNRIAIVTGAGAGLGKAYATALAKEGATVVIAEYSPESGRKVEKELLDQGYQACFMSCNVADEDNVRRVVEETAHSYGKIDILINNAQATDHKSLPKLLDQTPTELVKLNWTTGFLGTFFFIKYVLPYMQKAQYGRIVNTASATGVRGTVTFAAYGSQKEAIRGLTRVCANENGEYGITCNAICPGALTDASRAWKELHPEEYVAAVKPQAIKRLGDPETDIAPVVLFLVSDDARYVTGQTLGIDGGNTMMQ